MGGITDFKASAWIIDAQDNRGRWSAIGSTDGLVPARAVHSANRGDEEDDPAEAGKTVPQLMPVGIANPQMFACAGERTEDDTDRTTWLIESSSPKTAPPTGRIEFIQDLLYGDDRFVPNRPGPLRGPASPPTPRVSGPGNPIRRGSVRCAMVQVDDNVATRELHMIGIASGGLYHAVASNFGPVTSGSNFTFNRFRTVSPWGDVGQVLGGGFGTVVSAAIVARPSGISVLFVAQSGGSYRLWHAVRFSPGGSWRPADDVWSLSGDAPSGSVHKWQVSAGMCPAFAASVWTPQSTELVIAQWGGPAPLEPIVIRVVSTPQQWTPTVNGIYSPWRSVRSFPTPAEERNPRIANLVVGGRPFRDFTVQAP